MPQGKNVGSPPANMMVQFRTHAAAVRPKRADGANNGPLQTFSQPLPCLASALRRFALSVTVLFRPVVRHRHPTTRLLPFHQVSMAKSGIDSPKRNSRLGANSNVMGGWVGVFVC